MYLCGLSAYQSHVPHFSGSSDIAVNPEPNVGYMKLPICCLLVCTNASEKSNASSIKIGAWKQTYHGFPHSLQVYYNDWAMIASFQVLSSSLFIGRSSIRRRTVWILTAS
jgi:hypothetical protein